MSPFLVKFDPKSVAYGRPPRGSRDGIQRVTYLTEDDSMLTDAADSLSLDAPPMLSSSGRSLRAYKKNRRYGDGADSHSEFNLFDAPTPYGHSKYARPVDSITHSGSVPFKRHTGLTPDVGLLGFGSPSTGKSPHISGAGSGSHYFATGMTPSNATPLSDIACTYSNGSPELSPGYSPSIFYLLEGSPRPNAPPAQERSAERGLGLDRLIGEGLSAIKPSREELADRRGNCSIAPSSLAKRKIASRDDEGGTELDESFALTDSPSESSMDRSMSTR